MAAAVSAQGLQVLTWALGALLTVALFVVARVWSVLDGVRKENQTLRDANYALQLAVVELKVGAKAADRILSSWPTIQQTEGGNP